MIFRAPDSLAAVLLVGNVLIFVPLAFFGGLGWPVYPIKILVACLGLSVAIELTQALVLGRVGAIDDWLLNAAGTLLGMAAAAVALRVRRPVPPAVLLYSAHSG